MALVQWCASAASTAGVWFGHGPSSNVSTTSPGFRKSCCLKCSKPKPGPPVVSICTVRATPRASGLPGQETGCGAGGAAAGAAGAGVGVVAVAGPAARVIPAAAVGVLSGVAATAAAAVDTGATLATVDTGQPAEPIWEPRPASIWPRWLRPYWAGSVHSSWSAQRPPEPRTLRWHRQ